MKINKQTSNESIVGLNENGDFKPTSDKLITDEQGRFDLSNPAIKGYYNSIKRKNNAVTIATYFCLSLLGLILGLGAYYFAQIREPIIRLEEKSTFMQTQIDKNSDTIEDLKKEIYNLPQ